MRRTLLLIPLLTIGIVFLGCAKKSGTTTAEASADSKAASTSKSKADTGKVAAPVTGSGFSVIEAVACRAVQDRTPIETGSSFTSDVGRVYVYTKVGVAGGGETSIQHIWFHNDTKVATVTLPARGTSWRTYSSKAIQDAQKGKWRVDIASTEGAVIKSVVFTVD